jgi:hypothetical protein
MVSAQALAGSCDPVSPQEECTTVGKFKLSHLKLGLDPGNDRPVFAPVELKGFAWGKGQWDEGAASGRPGGFILRLAPVSGKGSDTVIGAFVAQRGEVGMNLPEIPPLLTVLLRFRL